tara:strand:+ start:7012 stop:7464 length:453 start_codon:yes stop_codon:yes gene_type:complete
MNFTKGLMLTCGATGAILAAVAMTGLSYDLKGARPTGQEARLTPHIVTLSPIPLILGEPDDVVLVSLSLTVPGAVERAAVCARANMVQSAAARLIRERVRASSPTGTTIPSDLDRTLHAAIADIVGDKQIERVAVIVTPAGATPPGASCS